LGEDFFEICEPRLQEPIVVHVSSVIGRISTRLESAAAMQVTAFSFAQPYGKAQVLQFTERGRLRKLQINLGECNLSLK